MPSTRVAARSFFVLVVIVGGPVVGYSLGEVDGSLIGAGVSTIALVAWATREQAKMNARLEAAPPVVARIASLLESKWGEDHRPHFRARLVRADGSLVGDFWLSPPPQFVDLLKPETRLLIQWHPDHPDDVIVDWRGSVDLPDHSGYRS